MSAPDEPTVDSYEQSVLGGKPSSAKQFREQARTALGAHYQQEIDLPAMFKDVAGAFVQQASAPAQVRHLVDRAIRSAIGERKVAAIILPNDLQVEKMEDRPHEHFYVQSGVGLSMTNPVPGPDALAAAAEVLASGARAQDAEAPEPTRGRVIAVFQPHLYSRTEEFAEQFAAALDAADEVIVADVYGAREAPIPGVSGRSITDRLTGNHRFVPDLSTLAGAVATIAQPGDIVLTLGAGDITMQGPEILAALDDARAASRTTNGGEGAS